MAGHTPGPWRVLVNGAGSRDIGTDDGGLATCFTHGLADDPTDEANARLIAAAPELLATLEAVERRLARTDGFDGTKEIIRAAIAKARGAA